MTVGEAAAPAATVCRIPIGRGVPSRARLGRTEAEPITEPEERRGRFLRRHLRRNRPSSAHISPARAEPHDATAWLPVPLPESLPTVDELLADDAGGAPAARETSAAPPSPARAEPHDATTWLPLPELHELPPIDHLLTPDPGVEAPVPRDVPVGTPSPARAQPHDATAWLPLPETDALPHIDEIVDPDRNGGRREGRVRSRGRRVPVRAALIMMLVLGMLGGVYWGASRLLDPGADVRIAVDGRQISVETGVSSVRSLLEEQRISLSDHDRIEPSGAKSIENGMKVRVFRGFPITLDLDGETKTVYTTYRGPRGVLEELDLGPNAMLRNPPEKVSEAKVVQVRTRKVGTLFLDGTAVEYRSPSHTVRELLEIYQADGRLVLGPQDFTTPAIDEVLPATASVTVVRVATQTEQIDEPYDVPDERQPDPNLGVGETRVQERVTGMQRVTYQVVNHDGQEAQRTAISRVPVTPATPRIDFYGTHYNPLWDKMARCETGGNWAATGQTYQGGLGIYYKNWNYYGGRAFAPTGGQATKHEQIIVAERIRKAHGWHAWGCADDIGL